MAKYGINKAILVGNLGRDPEIRYLDQGVAVANFTLATTESYRTKDGAREDRTQWHNIVMWRGLAETAGKFLRKGSTVYLEGKIINRSWDDEQGNKKYRTEIEVDNMVMLDSRPSGGGLESNLPPMNAYSGGGNQSGSYSAPASQPVVESNPKVSADDAADDLPF